MIEVRGTPVNINGRTNGSPGPAPSTSAMRVQMPMPPGRGTAATSTFARYMRVRNLDATNDLRVSLYDDTYVTIKAGAEEEFTGTIPFFSVQASAATVQWEAFAVVAA